MARVLYGSEITALKGSIGGITFHRNPSGEIAKLRPLSKSSLSYNQMFANILFSKAIAAWSSLTPNEQLEWKAFASDYSRYNYFNEEKILTGMNWYTSIYINSVLCGQTPPSSPPYYVLPPNPEPFHLIMSPSNIYLVFNDNYDYTSEYIYVFITFPNFSQSLSNRSLIRLCCIADPASAVLIDLTSSYLSLFELDSFPESPNASARILCSIAAISYSSFIASAFTSYLLRLPELTPFTQGTGFNGQVNKTFTLPSGKIIVAGNFTSFNGVARQRICRLNADGTLDLDFDSSSGFNDSVRCIVVQSDGKILCGGDFTAYSASNPVRIARINSDGSFDSSFKSSPGANGAVTSIAYHSYGYFIIVGGFTQYDSAPHNYIVATDTSGNVSGLFNFGTGFSAIPYCVIIDSNSRIVCVGNFLTYNSVARVRICRMSLYGTIDATFDPVGGFDASCSFVASDPNYNYYVVGSFTTYKGLTVQRIVKLDNYAAIDSSFSTMSAFNAQAIHVFIDNNGYINVSGYFTTYKSKSCKGFIRLRLDGSRDYSIELSEYTGSVIVSASIDAFYKLIINGLFTSINSVAVGNIARLFPDGTLNT
jgi:uncharacterized delta-60 repeat protein